MTTVVDRPWNWLERTRFQPQAGGMSTYLSPILPVRVEGQAVFAAFSAPIRRAMPGRRTVEASSAWWFVNPRERRLLGHLTGPLAAAFRQTPTFTLVGREGMTPQLLRERLGRIDDLVAARFDAYASGEPYLLDDGLRALMASTFDSEEFPVLRAAFRSFFSTLGGDDNGH